MIRYLAVAAALALSVVACGSETDENEPTQEQSDTPAVETELLPSSSGSIGYCLPQKLPICNNGFSCFCNSSGFRVCSCN